MNLTRDIQSLSTFKQNATALIKEMQRTKEPMVLTVNGKAAIVVQDTESYQALLEAKERMETIEGIRRGLACIQRGEVRDANEFFAEFFAKNEIPETE